MLKPLDIVKTPKGSIAMVTSVDNGKVSINYLGVRHFAKGGGANPTGERNSWWGKDDGLLLLDSIPRMLAFASGHPSCQSLKNANCMEDDFEERLIETNNGNLLTNAPN